MFIDNYESDNNHNLVSLALRTAEVIQIQILVKKNLSASSN